MRRSTLGFALSLITTPAVAQNCDGFVDVLASNPFCPDVTWLKTYGVTMGCDATHFCPNDNVSRLEMAAFMHRLGKDPAFMNGGNAFGNQATIGTTDNNSLTVIVDGERAMSLQPAVDSYFGFNPNVVNGMALNSVANGIAGATIAGGGGCNPSTGGTCTITFEMNQVTSSWGTVSGGGLNTAGYYATVPGGYGNTASGVASFAAGYTANAHDDYSFVWSGWTNGLMQSFGGHQFYVGADHGFSVDYYTQRTDGGGTRWIYFGDLFLGNSIVAWNGAVLTDGGAWTNASDRALKSRFTAVDAQAVLAKVAQLPIDEWSYKSEAGQRHLGPVAQDFYAAFGLGADDKHITTVDEGGVALAAIKGLYERTEAALQAKDREIASLRAELNAVKAALNLR